MITRGIKNNNPFNIRRNAKNKWLGRISFSDSTDTAFEQFKTMKYGLRAGIILLRNYIRSGFDTPSKIINRFAPSFENNPSVYIKYVCGVVGVGPDYRFLVGSPQFFYLAVAICQFESKYQVSILDLQNICFTFKIKLY